MYLLIVDVIQGGSDGQIVIVLFGIHISVILTNSVKIFKHKRLCQGFVKHSIYDF